MGKRGRGVGRETGREDKGGGEVDGKGKGGGKGERGGKGEGEEEGEERGGEGGKGSPPSQIYGSAPARYLQAPNEVSVVVQLSSAGIAQPPI